MNGNFNQFINGADNLDEQISVTDFIKTLKKVESNEKSSSSSSSTDKLCKPIGDKEDSKKIEKRCSGTDLLQNMRKRFVHRATEPIFHALPEGQVRRKSTKRKTSKEETTTS